MIDVTIANLEQQVIEASMTTPVLVDFWSPRSTPCKSLGPVLEKLEAEYAGRFVLAKVNSDVESEVAAMFGVRNVPTCVLMVQGRAVDGFTGAQPEPQIRALLDKHLAPAAAPEPEPELLDEDDDALLARMKNEVEMDASNDDKRFFYVKLLLELGHVDEAKAAFAPAIGKAAGIRYADDPEADYFLVKELRPGFLQGKHGIYRDPAGYFVCLTRPQEFADFEAQFPAK